MDLKKHFGKEADGPTVLKGSCMFIFGGPGPYAGKNPLIFVQYEK